MVREIQILFATETGTVELVADEVVEAYRSSAHVHFEAVRMDHTQPTIFHSGGVYLLITSSTGKGELPRNARAFCSALQALSTPLKQVRYGILGFGDRFYASTFGGGPRTLDQLMQHAGATRIGELAQHDRQSGTYAEEFALNCLQKWVTQLE